MRSKNITFTAQGLKPQTRVHPFFDKTNVANFVTPTGGSLGANIITDGNGEISGVYVIPDPNVAGNPKFKTGERVSDYHLLQQINCSTTRNICTSLFSRQLVFLEIFKKKLLQLEMVELKHKMFLIVEQYLFHR